MLQSVSMDLPNRSEWLDTDGSPLLTDDQALRDMADPLLIRQSETSARLHWPVTTAAEVAIEQQSTSSEGEATASSTTAEATSSDDGVVLLQLMDKLHLSGSAGERRGASAAAAAGDVGQTWARSAALATLWSTIQGCVRDERRLRAYEKERQDLRNKVQVDVAFLAQMFPAAFPNPAVPKPNEPAVRLDDGRYQLDFNLDWQVKQTKMLGRPHILMFAKQVISVKAHSSSFGAKESLVAMDLFTSYFDTAEADSQASGKGGKEQKQEDEERRTILQALVMVMCRW